MLLVDLRAKTNFDKRALVVEHLAITWNFIAAKVWSKSRQQKSNDKRPGYA